MRIFKHQNKNSVDKVFYIKIKSLENAIIITNRKGLYEWIRNIDSSCRNILFSYLNYLKV